MNIVLFDKDIRIYDHDPLVEACKLGDVLPLYIFQPSVWQGKKLNSRHFQFVMESLEDLCESLQRIGGNLFYSIGELDDILTLILKTYKSFRLFVHEHSFAERKRDISQWMEEHGQPLLTFGFIAKGEPYKKHFEEWLNEPIPQVPAKMNIPEHVPEGFFTDLKGAKGLSIRENSILFGQQGGEKRAMETLHSFLDDRFQSYISNYEKPIPSSFSSSRLSAYITWGNVSVRTVFQKAKQKIGIVEYEDEKLQIEKFINTLLLRDHILLKQDIENKYEGKRIDDEVWDEFIGKRWVNGTTGIPMIDASMRCLHKTGWINHSLRKMVVSFMCNTMRQDCRKVSMTLAEMFIDYEEAIHHYYVNLYNKRINPRQKIIDPIKFGKKIDPDGQFIRRYVPELSALEMKYIHEPWLYPGFFKLGYVNPIVDVPKANKEFKRQLEHENRHTIKKKKNKIVGEMEQLSFEFE